jgi:hypothetical protein
MAMRLPLRTSRTQFKVRDIRANTKFLVWPSDFIARDGVEQLRIQQEFTIKKKVDSPQNSMRQKVDMSAHEL